MSIESQSHNSAYDTQILSAGRRFLDDEQFYAQGSEAEANRLDHMAQIADVVSVEAITHIAGEYEGDQLIVVDIGAGDSVSLGRTLSGLGMTYVPVDIRQDAVESQRSAGFNAIQSSARNVDIISGSVDVVHSRFTWGWLNDDAREHALVEALRISKEDARLTFIDYDWSTVSGPPVFVDAVSMMQTAMRNAGFNPEFGKFAKEDIAYRLERMLVDHSKASISEHRESVYVGEIQRAVQIINKTATAVSAQLRQIGSSHTADEIDSGLVALEQYIVQHPHETVVLPDIVSVAVSLHDGSRNFSSYAHSLCEQHDSVLERLREREEQAFASGVDFRESFPGVRSMSAIGVARTPSLILAARRVQAEAYVNGGIVGSEAVGYDGALIVENDPVELVNRSEYLVSMGEGSVRGVVRIIQPNENGKESLPTVARLKAHSPQAWQELCEHPAMKVSERLVEVSALAKDASAGGFMDIMKAILALVAHAQSPEQGYRYGIMGLQEAHVPLILSVFGKHNFQRFTASDAIHAIDLPGVKNDVAFVPLIVDGQKFVTRAHAHAHEMLVRLGPEKGKVFARLRDMTAEIIDNSPHL